MKIIIIAFLVVIIISVFLVRAIRQEKKELSIEDRCGPFMGSIVHTIKDENICEMRCISQCDVSGYKLKKFKFDSGGVGCNSCTCICVR